MPYACFRRFGFNKCQFCSAPSLASRVRCYFRYITWYTDPLPVEHMIGWISLLWAAAIGFGTDALDEHWLHLWHVLPRWLWLVVMTCTGLMQVISPAFGTVKWVRKCRLANGYISAAVWTGMFLTSVDHLGFVPYSMTCLVYSLAGWWFCLRAGDSNPCPCNGGKK